MRRNHPPLPSAVRPIYWTLRTFGTLIGLGGILLAAVAAQQELWGTAIGSAGGGILFAVLTWLPPTSRWFLPLMTVLALGVALALRSWLIAGILLAVIAWGLWFRRRVGPIPKQFEIIEADAVMKNAGRFVDAFRAVGFESAGAYRARIGPVRIVVSVLLAPDHTSYASVTDAILEVTSLFPDGRRLITRNSNLNALPGDVLINPIPGAGPEALVAGHQRALGILAKLEHFPAALTASELAQMAVDRELRTIEWLKEQGRSRKPDDQVVLWARSDAVERIAAWHGGD
jgi:hypothetical protein